MQVSGKGTQVLAPPIRPNTRVGQIEPELQRRFTPRAPAAVAVSQRAEGAQTIRGYGAVFYDPLKPGTEYELWEDFRERIMPGAFDRALREKHDARGLWNHDPSAILGRVSAGTMRLAVDAQGLVYEIDLPDTAAGRDVAVSIGRGDVTGSSFAFVAQRVVWIEEGELLIRQIEDLELYDTGPVTWPAYEATSAGLRSGDLDSLRREADAWRAERRLGAGDWPAIRARVVEVGG